MDKSLTPQSLYTRDDLIRLGCCRSGVDEFANQHFPDATAVPLAHLKRVVHLDQSGLLAKAIGLSGYGYGDGDGSGYGYGDGSGDGSGYGSGYGYGDGSGSGDGSGYGYGDGSG